MYDAIVVGARCAGSPTAMLLARGATGSCSSTGPRFPSDTLSTHYIHQPGVARLERWGLLDRVAATGCPPIRRYTLRRRPVRAHGPPPPADGVAEAYAPRRYVLDTILVEAAAAAGAEVRERFSVEELAHGRRPRHRHPRPRRRRRDGDRAGAHRRSAPTACDSLVARSVGAPTYDARPALTCAYYSYWGGVAARRRRAVSARRAA